MSASQDLMIAIIKKALTKYDLFNDKTWFAKIKVVIKTFDNDALAKFAEKPEFQIYCLCLIALQQVSANKIRDNKVTVKISDTIGDIKSANAFATRCEIENFPDMKNPRGAIAAKIVRLLKTQLETLHETAFENIPELEKFFKGYKTGVWFCHFKNAILDVAEANEFIDRFMKLYSTVGIATVTDFVKLFMYQRLARAIIMAKSYTPDEQGVIYLQSVVKVLRERATKQEEHMNVDKLKGKITGVTVPDGPVYARQPAKV